jgi:ssDNA-binding Zn-finger/Zn-ribbon topoisomerase 1
VSDDERYITAIYNSAAIICPECGDVMLYSRSELGALWITCSNRGCHLKDKHYHAPTVILTAVEP